MGQKESWESFVLPAPFHGGGSSPWESPSPASTEPGGAPCVTGLCLGVSQRQGQGGMAWAQQGQGGACPTPAVGRLWEQQGGNTLGKDAHAAGSSLWMTTAISRQVASPVPFAGGKGIIPRSPWQERSPWHVPPHAYLVYSKWSYKSVEWAFCFD